MKTPSGLVKVIRSVDETIRAKTQTKEEKSQEFIIQNGTKLDDSPLPVNIWTKVVANLKVEVNITKIKDHKCKSRLARCNKDIKCKSIALKTVKFQA